MSLIFFASEKPREQDLGAAFVAGARQHGWDAEVRPLCAMPDLSGASAVAMVGVKSKRLFDRAREAGAVPIMLDKGYIRSRRPDSRVWEYWRVSVGSHHPTRTTLMRRKMPTDRLDRLGVEVRPWRTRGFSVVVAGSSAKYHSFYEIEEPNGYYRDLVEHLRELTNRPLIYRPKPSYREAKRVKGAQFSLGDENISQALEGAWALVTHGSNACFEAALLGIPSIVLGDGIAAPISSTRLEAIEEPQLGKRTQWLANLAYHQWSEDEMRSGEAFDHIGGWVDDQRTK